MKLFLFFDATLLLTTAHSFVVNPPCSSKCLSAASTVFVSAGKTVFEECEDFVGSFVETKEASIHVGDLGHRDNLLPFSSENVEEILREIRPFLQEHGGNVQLESVDMKNKDVYLRLEGQCATCPLAEGTLQDGVQRGFASSLEGFGQVRRA